jgi:hypothetical protein
MVYTRRRISDTALFDLNRVSGNEVFLRAKKTEAMSSLTFPIGSLNALRRDQHLAAENRQGLSTRPKVRRDPTPHSFHPTFVRILLQRGVPAVNWPANLTRDPNMSAMAGLSRMRDMPRIGAAFSCVRGQGAGVHFWTPIGLQNPRNLVIVRSPDCTYQHSTSAGPRFPHHSENRQPRSMPAACSGFLTCAGETQKPFAALFIGNGPPAA